MAPGSRTRAASSDALRRGLAVAVKLLHTAIFAVVSTCILYVFVSGVRGRPTRWTGAAIMIVLAEMLVFVGNRWRCPLTRLAEQLGAESGRVTDIFLPRWFADRIPQLYTPPFLIGVLALLWHRRRGRLARRLDPVEQGCAGRVGQTGAPYEIRR